MTQKLVQSIFENTERNIFITGGAGTGKTYLATKLINYLKKKRITYGVVAPTGIASSHLNGTTIHSAFGLGVKSKLTEKDTRQILSNKWNKKRFDDWQVLIIDEVSMVSHELFDTISELLKDARGNSNPFGGVRVVVIGDFFQLPPIIKGNKSNKLFAFQSKVWKESNFISCYLTEKHRQAKGDTLISVLDAIRENRVLKEHLDLLDSVIGEQGENTSKLYTHNVNVDKINREELDKLPSKEFIFKAGERGNSYEIDRIFKNSLVERTLTIKKGAVVMMIKNSKDKGYVNGTLATVVSISQTRIIVDIDGIHSEIEREEWDIKDEDKVIAKITQFPIKLSWAITIHKSQGMTLGVGKCYIDLSRTFEVGQGYVALSRVKSLDSIVLGGYNEKSLCVHPMVLKVDPYIKRASEKFEKEFSYLINE